MISLPSDRVSVMDRDGATVTVIVTLAHRRTAAAVIPPGPGARTLRARMPGGGPTGPPGLNLLLPADSRTTQLKGRVVGGPGLVLTLTED